MKSVVLVPLEPNQPFEMICAQLSQEFWQTKYVRARRGFCPKNGICQ
jgi:hypothetical protein